MQVRVLLGAFGKRYNIYVKKINTLIWLCCEIEYFLSAFRIL